MSNLRTQIDLLATQFAGQIIEALRLASLDDLMAIAGDRRGGGRARSVGGGVSSAIAAGGPRRRGRLGRRSQAQIGRMVDEIVDLLTKNAAGLRAEQIRSALNVQAKELPRPLADALASGRVTKTGQKRATTYFVSGGGAKRGRRGAKKKA